MEKTTIENTVHFTNDFALYAQIGYTEAMEMRIFLGIVSQVNPFDETEAMEGILSFGQIEQLVKGADKKRSGSLSKLIQDTIKTMLKKNYIEFITPVEYRGKKLSKYRVIFDRLSPEIIDGTPFYKWRLHEDMRPHVKNLLKNFVQISLPKSMRSSHSIRFLIMGTAHHNRLRKHKITTTMRISLTEFKRVLNLEGKYPRFNNFKIKVIQQIVKEVNASGLLLIKNYELIKTGRKVSHIDFFLQDGILINGKKADMPELNFEEKPKPIPAKTKKRKSDPTKKEINKLTFSQLKAFDFLVSKKCFGSVAYKAIFEMPTIEFIGWEDVFLKLAWEIFNKGTKYRKPESKAGAFVKWWQNGEFKDRHLGELIDKVSGVKKSKSEEEYENREKAKTMTAKEFTAEFMTKDK